MLTLQTVDKKISSIGTFHPRKSTQYFCKCAQSKMKHDLAKMQLLTIYFVAQQLQYREVELL